MTSRLRKMHSNRRRDGKEIIGAGGSVTVAQLRDRMGASRRPVLALLEFWTPWRDAPRRRRRVLR